MRIDFTLRGPILDFGSEPGLVVGVTGHRDLRPEDISILEERVASKLQVIKAVFPEARLVLLSALAEGSDQLVARVALEMAVWKLVVPLPFHAGHYREILAGEDSRRQFDNLLGRASASFVVSTDLFEPDELDAFGEADPNLPYAAVGKVIAASSDILLALWDGDTTEKTGGTSQVIRRMRTRAAKSKPGIIYPLATSRMQSPGQVNPCNWQDPMLVGDSTSEVFAISQIRGRLAKSPRSSK